MDEKRKAWCEKYNVKMDDGGFIEKYCAPEHVECMLPNLDGPMNELIYVGWDGRATTWNGLTEEEKQDFEEKIKDNVLAKMVHHYELKEQNEREDIGREPGE